MDDAGAMRGVEGVGEGDTQINDGGNLEPRAPDPLL
jgi:hypothetical protein